MHALDQGSLLVIGGVVGGVLLGLWALGAWLLYIGPKRPPPPSKD